MPHNSYYDSDIASFCPSDPEHVLGKLTGRHGFNLEIQQRIAWQEQIRILQDCLSPNDDGWIYFEFSIPRMGKRADSIIVVGGIVFVIEFKIGAERFDRAGVEQVHDYALDLKNFHRGSHRCPIVPVLVASKARARGAINLHWAEDDVATPVCVSPQELRPLITSTLASRATPSINPPDWAQSGYQPTPTIVEAAQALYRNHDVKDIARSDARAQNLSITTDRISEIIEHAKAGQKKTICFVTGVPGAGKTLAGLNIATTRAHAHAEEHAVFLSGNGPLVEVLREALARDQAARDGTSKKDAHRKVGSFVQNIHHFRDACLKDPAPPDEKVVVFDEAQRAWNQEKVSQFMRQKRDYADFNMSEPAFLISAMDRHQDWCVVVCLVGGGQEINTGEAGLAEWLHALNQRFPTWEVFVSNRLEDPAYVRDESSAALLSRSKVVHEPSLHLSVSMRSFRAETLSDFVRHLLENRTDLAREAYANIASRYPILLTRDIEEVRRWLKTKARGTERFGLVASSGAHRLRAEGICVKAKVDASMWFLNERDDVRSSYYLEEVATEFDVQGLELDWTGVCWDADYRYESSGWRHYSFRGTSWQQVNAEDRKLYLENAYRVILTRARQGMVIYVPRGSKEDPTRPPAFYDATYEHLRRCGLKTIEEDAHPA